MSIPQINTRATNVELTDERKSLIMRKLTPLARFLAHEPDVVIDVVMRRMRTRLGGEVYYLSVKVATPTTSYVTVASESHLAKALTVAKEKLRQTISRGASASDYGLRRSRRQEALYTLTL